MTQLLENLIQETGKPGKVKTKGNSARALKASPVSGFVGGDGQNLQLWEGRGARQGALDVYKPSLHGKRRKGSP